MTYFFFLFDDNRWLQYALRPVKWRLEFFSERFVFLLFLFRSAIKRNLTSVFHAEQQWYYNRYEGTILVPGFVIYALEDYARAPNCCRVEFCLLFCPRRRCSRSISPVQRFSNPIKVNGNIIIAFENITFSYFAIQFYPRIFVWE